MENEISYNSVYSCRILKSFCKYSGIVFKIFFIYKYIKIKFLFYFLNFNFDINISKLSKNLKKYIFFKLNFYKPPFKLQFQKNRLADFIL